MVLRSWNKKSEHKIHELIHGRSYWSDVTLEQINEGSVQVTLQNNKKEKNGQCSEDGPRGAGVALSALFNVFPNDGDLPKHITIVSKTGFREETRPIFNFLSDITLRRTFIKSFGNGENIRTFEKPSFASKKPKWKQYEEYVQKKMAKEFNGFTESINIPGIDTDGILKKNDEIIIYETKMKQIDLAEGLTQLIQYFIQVINALGYLDKDISCFLISSEPDQSDNFKRGLKFLKSPIVPNFILKEKVS
jgi:hypothetical protein